MQALVSDTSSSCIPETAFLLACCKGNAHLVQQSFYYNPVDDRTYYFLHTHMHAQIGYMALHVLAAKKI